MKNKKLKNLFIRGGKSALAALAMATMIACDQKPDPNAKIENDEGFIYLIALIIVGFVIPLSLDYFGNYNRNHRQR